MSMKLEKRTAPAPPQAHHPYVEALIDPRNAAGVRMPDNYKSGTTALKLVEEFTVTTNGGGSMMFGVQPGVNRSIINSAVVGVTSAVSETYVQHPDYTAFTGAHLYARVLFYMVEITYIGAEQTSAGRLCCVNTVGTNHYQSVDITTMFDDAGCVMAAQQGMSCIVRPFQEPRLADASTLGWATDYLQVMYFAVTGAPISTTVFDVRVSKFVEGVPLRTSLMRGMVSVEPSVPNALAIAANIGTDQADTVANTTEGRKGQVSRARKMADLAWKLLLVAGPSFGIPTATLGSMASLASQLSQLRLGA